MPTELVDLQAACEHVARDLAYPRAAEKGRFGFVVTEFDHGWDFEIRFDGSVAKIAHPRLEEDREQLTFVVAHMAATILHKADQWDRPQCLQHPKDALRPVLLHRVAVWQCSKSPESVIPIGEYTRF